MMKTIFKILTVVYFASIFTSCASSEKVKEKSSVVMPYSQLKIMDLDQMSDIMYLKANQYKQSDDPKALQDGLLICLSRPNEDGLIEKIISIVKTPLEDNNLWESSIEGIVETGIATFKNSQASAVDQVTYGVALENIVSEFKPAFVKQYQSPGFETKIIQRIADADLEFSSQAITERKLNMMKGHVSPSVYAKKLVEKKQTVLKK